MAIVSGPPAARRDQKHQPSYRSYQVSNVAAPAKIKCRGCDTVKGPNSYSKKQLGDLALTMSNKPGFNAAQKGEIRCIICTGGQVVELTCHICDKTKGLDKFPKVARKTPDKAMCQKCSQEKRQYEPRDSDSNDSNGGSNSDSDDSNDGEDFQLASRMNGASLGTYASQSGTTTATGSNGGGAPGTATMSRGTGGGGVSVASTKAAQPVRKAADSNSKWARVPKGPKAKPANSASSDEGSPQVSSSEDDDDDNDDDDGRSFYSMSRA